MLYSKLFASEETFLLPIFRLTLTAFFSGLNFTVMPHDFKVKYIYKWLWVIIFSNDILNFKRNDAELCDCNDNRLVSVHAFDMNEWILMDDL